jgi:hypothetical protein
MNGKIHLFEVNGMHEGVKTLPSVKFFAMVVSVNLSPMLLVSHSWFLFLLFPFQPLSKNLTRLIFDGTP